MNKSETRTDKFKIDHTRQTRVLLTAKEVAERYGYTVETVYVKKCRRELPFVKIPGHRAMYPLDELEKMEDEGLYEVK